jgi:hypothetical protein
MKFVFGSYARMVQPSKSDRRPVQLLAKELPAQRQRRDTSGHLLPWGTFLGQPRFVDKRMVVVVAVMAVVAMTAGTSAGCQPRTMGLPRVALGAPWPTTPSPEEPLPTHGEALRLRAPNAPSAPSEVVGGHSALAFARGEAPGPLLTPVDEKNAGDAARLCLFESLTRAYDRIVPACMGFATARPADPRAAAAIEIAASHRSSLDEPARRALWSGVAKVVSACAAFRGPATSCAELALVVDDTRRHLAASLGDKEAWLSAQPGGDLTRAKAEGPFLDADESFANSAFAARPLAKHSHFRSFELESADGLLSPSRHGVSGWWRLTWHGETATPRVGILAVRAVGALQMRVDDVVVLVRRPEDLRANVEEVGVRLEAGVHTIELLVQETGHGVRVSGFGDDGAPLFLAGSSSRQGPPSHAATIPLVGMKAALPLPPMLDGRDVEQLTNLLFLHAMARSGIGFHPDDERAFARFLITHFGWSTPALAAAAPTIEDDALPDRIAVGLAGPVWSSVLARWPQHPPALLSFARAAADERPEEVLARYRALVAAAPRYPIGRRELIDVLLDRGVFDEARANAEALLALGETNENIDAAARALHEGGAVSRAARLLALRARRTIDDDARALTAEGRKDEATSVLRQRVDSQDVQALSAWLDRVEVAEPNTALEVASSFLVRFPDDVALHLRRAELLARTKGVRAALEALDALPTTDARALRMKAAWGGGSPIGDRLALGDHAIEERRTETTPTLSGFPTVLLLDDFERRYAEDGSSVAVRHWIAELRTKDALDAFGELRVGDDENLARLRVVKPDGSIIEPERHAGVEDVSLPRLSPGDIVEFLSWRVDSAARDGAGWESVSLVRSVPALLRRVVIEVPETLEHTRRVTVLSENGAGVPTVEVLGSPDHQRTRYLFESRAAPPLLDEPGSVDRLESEPQAGLAIDFDDDVIRRRRQRAFDRAARVDPWLVDVAKLVAGQGNETERVHRLFRFVTKTVVEADAPADAVSTLALGRGARQPLFHALVRALGLPVDAIALHATLDRDRRLPHAAAFPVTVSRVRVDREEHVVAFVGGAATWDGLSPWFAGAQTLDLHHGTMGRLDDRHIDRTAPEVTVDLEARAAGDVQAYELAGVVAVRLPGSMAGSVRTALRRLTTTALAQALEGALSDSLPGVKVANVQTPGLDVDIGPLALVAQVQAPSPTTLRLEHLFSNGALAAFRLTPPLSSWTTVAERRRALLVAPGSESLEVRLRVPPRSGILETPADVNLQAGPFSLMQKSLVFDDGLLWQRRIERRAARIEPLAWPEVRTSLAALVGQADARLLVVLPGPTPTPASGAPVSAAVSEDAPEALLVSPPATATRPLGSTG